MAIALDADLGTASANGPAYPWVGGSGGFQTSAAAAASSLIVLQVSWWSNVNEVLSTPSGGSLTWAIDYQHANASSDRYAICSAQAPSGLSSGTNITLTWTGQSSPLDGGVLVSCASFTGLASSSALTATATADTSGTTWTTGSASNSTPDSLVIGGTGLETATSSSNTWTTGTELHDFWLSAAQQGITTGYNIVSSTASQTLAGTNSPTSTASTTGLAIYKAAAAGAAATPVFIPHRMPLGV